jgi:hypothetical protein
VTVPSITDEELAEMERGHVRMEAPFNTPGFCRRCSHFWPCPMFRLIAALRASRAENERLRQESAMWREGAQRSATERDALRGEPFVVLPGDSVNL